MRKTSVSAWGMLAAGLWLASAGCGGRPGPTLAGGKPVSFWTEALSDPDGNVRRKAVEKLGNVGQADPQAFPAVLSALRDADATVRQAAARAVPKFGERGREAVAVLTTLESDDSDAEVRAAAGKALAAVRTDGR